VGLSLRLLASSFDDVTPSSSEEILSLTSDLLVEGFVSASSGQISLSETDLHVRGAQDLFLKRTYVPPRILGRYDDNDKSDRFALSRALSQLETKGWVTNPHLWAGYNRHSKYFQVCDPQGFVLEFQIRGNRGVLKTSSHGCSNLRGGEPNSAADIRNIELWVDKDEARVVWPDGTQRFYHKKDARTYWLEQEVLPNGKIVRYEYKNRLLAQITSSDPVGKYTYASITRDHAHHYSGSDGSKAELTYERRKIEGKIKVEKGRIEASFQFPVMTKAVNPFYSNTIGYDNRTLLNSYDAKAYPLSCSYFQIKDTPSRIQTFTTPSGSSTFAYDPAIAGKRGGSTTVTYADGAQTIYRFNKILLLEAIENWFEGKLVNKKTFEYDSKQHIKIIETRDCDGKILIAKHFECDLAGNPTVEITEGNFGTFTIRRGFDQNRIVFEDRDDGLQTKWTYLGTTWLITSKTIYERDEKLTPVKEEDFLKPGKQIRKITYHYDAANNLYLVEEEGRTKLSYILYQTVPHLHRVEWEEMVDWKGNAVYKIHYEYDHWGNTNEEQHYGSDGKLSYTIQRTYNEKGELLDETNPVGEKAIYKWDARGRCYYEEPISNGLAITRTFDAKGRLKALAENDRETTFEYNSSDLCIEKIDPLGYITTYDYHPVHGKPELILYGVNESLSSMKAQGKVIPTSRVGKVALLKPESKTEIKYDAWGRETEVWDSYDSLTHKEYNSYGSPAKVTHPDGGIETSTHRPNCLIESHIDADGLKTSYTYDTLSRLKEKTIGAYTTYFEYDNYDLKKITDAEGFITVFEYDLLGRKIEATNGQRVSKYGYDSLGFLAWEERGKRKIKYTNDALGRLRKKSVDEILHTSWGYDRGGNINSIQRGGVTTFKYDAHNRLIEETSPEGYVTTIEYEKEPKVLLKKITDPRKIETKETYSPQGNLLKKEVAGKIVETFEYDQTFRLAKRDHIVFGYTQNGYKKSMTEAGKRSTKWTYTAGDRLLTEEKPDGKILKHEYDDQCRLEKVGSRKFRYDALNRIVGSTHFTRTLDRFGNIKREEWTNGLWIESDYDDWDRPIERRLPDSTRIQYEYEGPFLKEVIRLSNEGKKLYSHTYKDFDARGNPQFETGMIETKREYNLSGRRKLCQNPYFQETVEYDPAGNVSVKGNTTYTYDTLGQMTSESKHFTAQYDVRYNLSEFNGHQVMLDTLNQIEGLPCDLNGNLSKEGFVYDEFNQLIEADSEPYVYDALGRRISKGNTTFLYIGDEEIGAYEGTQPKEIKVPGLTDPIAIEIKKKPYAPIMDVQGTIRLLIDPTTAEIAFKNECDAFGFGLTDVIPYAYAGKRYDAETGLVYFGKRFYDPSLRRWLTLDPMGPADHSNLYQYVFNNPFYYRDPSGENILGFFCGIGQIALGGAIMISGAALEIVTLGGYTFALGFHEAVGLALMTSGCAFATYHAQDISLPAFRSRNTPDPPMPTSKNKQKEGPSRPKPPIPIPDINSKDKSRQSSGTLQKQVEQNKAPKSIDRIDRGRGEYEKDHVHFKDGSALNYDGSWKHGEKLLTRDEIQWMTKNGWVPPKE
jgi:RHS repeat-associated protein